MGDSDDTLRALLGQVRPSPVERAAFARTDPEATRAMVQLLTAAAVLFNASTVADFGGRFGPTRGIGLVEQVVAAAFQTFAGRDPHPGPFDKAAMLLRGITQGHPFNDENKRTGFLLAAYYLDLAGHPMPPRFPVADVLTLGVRVSAGDVRYIAEIAAELERLWRPDTTDRS